MKSISLFKTKQLFRLQYLSFDLSPHRVGEKLWQTKRAL